MRSRLFNNISCNFSGNSVNSNSLNIQNFNPVEKIIQLHDEKIALYESMLKEKDEMMVRLERLIGGEINFRITNPGYS